MCLICYKFRITSFRAILFLRHISRAPVKKSDLMSRTLESGNFNTTLFVSWRVQIGFSQTKSPKFHFGNGKCFHMLCLCSNGNIDLGVDAIESSFNYPLLCVSIQVEGTSKGHVLPELTDTKYFWRPSQGSVIWTRKISEVQAADPTFKPDHPLTFLVTFEKANSMRDEYSTLCLEGLTEDFDKLLDANSNPDVELHCEGHITRAHKNIICARSPVLASMFHSDMVEGRTGVANIQDMTNDTLQQFLRYLYTGKLDKLTFESALCLYEVGDLYAVTRLSSKCSKFIIKSLTLVNVFDALVVADAHSDSKFMEEVICFMLDNKVPSSGGRWSDFCESHSKLADNVYGRFSEMSLEKRKKVRRQ